jgi:hypothetical protein
MKPFVISKTRAKGLKAGKTFLVDLKASTTGFVYSVKVHGELAIKKGK